MDKVFQVFVSSTFSDLADERRQVTNTLAKAGYIAAGMELFPATDQQQLDFIKRVIDRSDYYVVIVAGRYGSLADDKLSFTEHEYEYALSKGIPVLAFLHAEPDKIETGKTDKDPAKAKSLEAFRARLSMGRIVDFWKSAPDLCTTVLTAVVQTTNLFPATGWVRGDQAIDPKLLQDMERLRIENATLKNQLDQMTSSDLVFPTSLAGPDDQFVFHVSIKDYDPDDRINPTIITTSNKIVSIKIGEIFISIFEILLAGPNEYSLRSSIGSAIVGLTDELSKQKGRSFEVSGEDITQLRFHLEALGLIQAMGVQGQFSNHLIWTITDKGRRYVTRAKGIRK
jgi:hypothetical protein